MMTHDANAELARVRADRDCEKRMRKELTEALTRLRDDIKAHPLYHPAPEDDPMQAGGTAAHLAYWARIADAALNPAGG